MYVLTADQRGSRSDQDLVPAALRALTDVTGDEAVLPFERTAGDELQGVLADPALVVDVVLTLVRADAWRIGIGVGTVETPLPRSTRAARGEAFIAAREAVQAARRSPQGVAAVSGLSYAEHAGPAAVHLAESALWLTCSLLRRRTEEGWAVVDLLRAGLPQKEVASRLGISPSAVSQRVRAAGWTEERRAHELCVHLLAAAGADQVTRP